MDENLHVYGCRDTENAPHGSSRNEGYSLLWSCALTARKRAGARRRTGKNFSPWRFLRFPPLGRRRKDFQLFRQGARMGSTTVYIKGKQPGTGKPMWDRQEPSDQIHLQEMRFFRPFPVSSAPFLIGCFALWAEEEDHHFENSRLPPRKPGIS